MEKGLGKIELIEDVLFYTDENYKTPSRNDVKEIDNVYGYHIKTDINDFYILVENEKNKNCSYLLNGVFHSDEAVRMLCGLELKDIQVADSNFKLNRIVGNTAFDFNEGSQNGCVRLLIYIGEYMFEINSYMADGQKSANKKFVILNGISGVREVYDAYKERQFVLKKAKTNINNLLNTTENMLVEEGIVKDKTQARRLAVELIENKSDASWTFDEITKDLNTISIKSNTEINTMTIKEFIKELSNFDGDLPVVLVDDDGAICDNRKVIRESLKILKAMQKIKLCF